MSRSGYTDYCDPLALGRWRQAVNRALHGKRGQTLLRDLAEALDAMDDKRLYPGSFATADGEFCALGVLAAKRGTQVDDLGDADNCDPAEVGKRFGIARAMAAEIMYLNDEYSADEWTWIEVEICGPMPPAHLCRDGRRRQRKHEVRVRNDNHARERWEYMRRWVAENMKTQGAE